MRVYVGQTRAAALIRRLAGLGFGECVARGELPPRRGPWFYDNGAFADWRAGRPFDELAFERDVRRMRLWSERGAVVGGELGRPLPLPDFIVLPDLVGAGYESLRFTESFVDGWRRPIGGYPAGVPLYVAVQDGMDRGNVALLAHGLGGIFVGGTLEWKLRTAPAWVGLAHAIGLECHVGRVGTFDRLRWAQRIGVDSVDSCLPLWSEDNLARFCRGLEESPQRELALVE